MVSPMLATAGALPPDNGLWVFEGKWDGVRALVEIGIDGVVGIRSRNDLDTTRSWPELSGLGATLPPGTVLDGEIVAINSAGAPDFGLLQQRMHVQHPPVALLASVPAIFMAFDLVRFDGHDLTPLSWTERREVLESLALEGPASVPPAFDGPGAAVLDACMRQGLEGVLAKKRSSTYVSGRRSPDWIKVKPLRRQEFVIGGWEEGQGGRSGQLGALALGVFVGSGDLHFVGKVGTGFTDRTLRELGVALSARAADTSPFTPARPEGLLRRVHWVSPELVCEVAFSAWTGDDKLRHPSYKGMRNDKPARDVIREE